MGQSGAGKSSLLNLLLGFALSRIAKVNGIELRELEPQVWRSQLSWVGQNPHLPEQTLATNILLRQPDASEHQLQQAVERAYINEF